MGGVWGVVQRGIFPTVGTSSKYLSDVVVVLKGHKNIDDIYPYCFGPTFIRLVCSLRKRSRHPGVITPKTEEDVQRFVANFAEQIDVSYFHFLQLLIVIC